MLNSVVFRVALALVTLSLVYIEIVDSANPNYSYHVKIQDPQEANYQEKAETRKGDYAEGFYSVVEPNGALRTVTYTADEWGFKPTITYSYGHPVSPVKKVFVSPVQQQPVVHTVPAVSYQQLYSKAQAQPVASAGPALITNAAGASGSFGFVGSNNAYTSASATYAPYQYAAASASYGAPLVSVKETRSFVKSPQVYLQPQPTPIVAAVPPPQPEPQPAPIVYQTYQPQQYIQYQEPVVTAVEPVAPAPQPQPVYNPPLPSPSPIPEYFPPPQPSPSPIPEYLPPPSPSPAVYFPPPQPSSTPAPTYLPPAVEIRGPSKSSEGYSYPAPVVQLRYPVKRVKKVKIQRPSGEYLPPPPGPSPTPATVFFKDTYLIPPPAVELAVPLKPVKQIVQRVNYVQPSIPLIHKVHYAAPPQPTALREIPAPSFAPVQPISYVQQQPVIQKVQYKAPVLVQPAPPPVPVIQKIQYEPAQITHAQYHISRSPQPQPAPIYPAAAPVVNYAPQIQTYEAPSPIVQVQATPAPFVVQKYEDIVQNNQHLMRYGETPVLPAPAPRPVQPIFAAGASAKQNPLTFNYGYDNGVSKVSHSYFGSGW